MKQNSWRKDIDKLETIKVSEMLFPLCCKCDNNGLVSMLEVRNHNKDKHGKLNYNAQFYPWSVEKEIDLRAKANEHRMVGKTSQSCLCARGEAFYRARDMSPHTVSELNYKML